MSVSDFLNAVSGTAYSLSGSDSSVDNYLKSSPASAYGMYKPAELNGSIIGGLVNARNKDYGKSSIPVSAVTARANLNSLADQGVDRIARRDLQNLKQGSVEGYNLPYTTAYDNPILSGLSWVGDRVDDLNYGLGLGIDTMFDNTVGNFASAINPKLGTGVKDFLNADSLANIIDVGSDIGLILAGGLPGAAVVAGKALGRNARPINDAIVGIDSVTGEELTGGQRAAKGGLAGLDLALSMLPGAGSGVFKAASKGVKDAGLAKAAKDTVDRLAPTQDILKAEDIGKAWEKLTPDAQESVLKNLEERGFVRPQEVTPEEMLTQRLNGEFTVEGAKDSAKKAVSEAKAEAKANGVPVNRAEEEAAREAIQNYRTAANEAKAAGATDVDRAAAESTNLENLINAIGESKETISPKIASDLQNAITGPQPWQCVQKSLYPRGI